LSGPTGRKGYLTWYPFPALLKKSDEKEGFPKVFLTKIIFETKKANLFLEGQQV